MNIRDNDLSTDIHFVTFDLETTGLHPVSCPLIATFSGHSMHLGPYRPSLSSTTEVTRTLTDKPSEHILDASCDDREKRWS